MTFTTDDGREFSFGSIQLNTDEAERGFHRRNAPDQIQRPDVVDDICRGLLLQARIDRIIHGRESEDGNPASLVVFGFRFHGIDTQRRFKQAKITILFQDEARRDDADPEPIMLWPNGDFTLGKETPIDVESTRGFDAGINAGAAEVTGQANWKWERKLNYQKNDRARLTGSVMLDMDVRDYGSNNAIRLTLTEDTAANSGIVTDFRAAVLLRRRNDADRFLAHVSIKAKANFLYNAVRGMRDLSGFSPANEPVVFVPGVQYLRLPMSTPFPDTKLAEDIDNNNLNEVQLDGLAGALGSTVLAMSVG